MSKEGVFYVQYLNKKHDTNGKKKGKMCHASIDYIQSPVGLGQKECL
jgi:hypothetical protein